MLGTLFVQIFPEMFVDYSNIALLLMHTNSFVWSSELIMSAITPYSAENVLLCRWKYAFKVLYVYCSLKILICANKKFGLRF